QAHESSFRVCRRASCCAEFREMAWSETSRRPSRRRRTGHAYPKPLTVGVRFPYSLHRTRLPVGLSKWYLFVPAQPVVFCRCWFRFVLSAAQELHLVGVDAQVDLRLIVVH